MKASVLIVGKTQMNQGEVCIGGITWKGSFVRLINPDGSNQPQNTYIDLREVWDIEYQNRDDVIPPHVEDVIVEGWKKRGILKKDISVKQFLEDREIPVYYGEPDNLFGNVLRWSKKGSGYLLENRPIPSNSVGFWLPDKDLEKSQREDQSGIRYDYPSEKGNRSLKYKGLNTSPPSIIPAGTLLRVSLGRWWTGPDGEFDPACWLQLSGWFDLDESNLPNQESQNTPKDDPADDLPF